MNQNKCKDDKNKASKAQHQAQNMPLGSALAVETTFPEAKMEDLVPPGVVAIISDKGENNKISPSPVETLACSDCSPIDIND